MSERYVAVVGSSEPAEDTDRIAEEVGRELGKRGVVMVCGGLGGVMEAVARGASQAGGRTIGILPGLDRSVANEHIDVAIATGLGEVRNALVVRAADAVIAVGGAYGTLSEIGLALRSNTPVVGISTWEISREGLSDDAIVRADSPSAAVDRALQLAGDDGKHATEPHG